MLIVTNFALAAAAAAVTLTTAAAAASAQVNDFNLQPVQTNASLLLKVENTLPFPSVQITTNRTTTKPIFKTTNSQEHEEYFQNIKLKLDAEQVNLLHFINQTKLKQLDSRTVGRTSESVQDDEELIVDQKRNKKKKKEKALSRGQEGDEKREEEGKQVYKRRETFNPKGRHGSEEKSVSMLTSHLRKDAIATGQSYDTESTMISKSTSGYFIINNITLKSCRDVLKPVGLDRCTLTDYIEDCANDEGLIDYVAFFFCAFSPEKLPLALIISILWLLTLFVATGVTATDFLCPALFMISKTLGLSQNIAGVTFLAFGNTSADIFAGSGTLITTAIVGCVFAIKDFRLDRVIFVRDTLFYVAAVSLLFYIFNGPGRIRLQDSIALLSLYVIYVIVVLISKYFTKDKPLKNLHGPSKRELGESGGIEFEGVYIDDDPTASMVVMRRFLFYDDDKVPYPIQQQQQQQKTQQQPIQRHTLVAPTLKIDKLTMENGQQQQENNLSVATHKSSRRVTLFEDNLFEGANNNNNNNNLSPDYLPRRSRSASLLSISKSQLNNLRRASRDIRRQSMDFLAAVSPIDINVWKQRNWGGRTMELVKAPIRLFLLITTPMAYAGDGRSEWNKLLSTLHCITGPIFVVYAFGYASTWLGPLTIGAWVFLISAPTALLIIFTSSSETPPFYYNAYSSYLGFIVAVTWIYTISSEVINLLRALGIAFNLSNEIMGLTILAWGNCLLDFITNVSIARKGLPKMAIAACYGGPLMSTLVGIGLPAFITLLLDPNHNTKLGASPLLYIIFFFLIFALISALIIIILLRFNVKRSVGIYLISLYALLIIAEWSAEFNLIKLPFLTT